MHNRSTAFSTAVTATLQANAAESGISDLSSDSACSIITTTINKGITMVLVKAKRDEILGPLSAVSGIIERRHTLPILSNVLIERAAGALSFLATDIEIQITAHGCGRPAGEARRSPSARASWSTSCARCRTARGDAAAAGQAPAGEGRQEPLHAADAAGGGFPAPGEAGRRGGALCAAAEGAAAAARPGAVRDGAAGHPLLPERPADGGRGQAAASWSRPTATAWRLRRWRWRPSCRGRR